MKRSSVIDVNVLIVANGNNVNATDEDEYVCADFLKKMGNRIVSIDDLNHIFKEYFTHLSRSGQPGPGDKFAKWLWDNQANTQHVEKVSISPIYDAGLIKSYAEFPIDNSLEAFDLNDRKYVAVALTSVYRSSIVNASDSDWLQYLTQLEFHGICIINLCPRLADRQQ
jgi:hypothetical protein